MRDTLTKADVTRLLRRLAATYGKPFGARADDQVEEYHRVLAWADATAVAHAVDEWIAHQTRWPTPAALRLAVQVQVNARAADQRRRARDTSTEGSCHGCGTEYTWRSWLITRKARLDQRPTAVEFEREDGQVLELVLATRMVCDCTYRGILRGRQDHELAGDPANPFAHEELRRRGRADSGPAPRDPVVGHIGALPAGVT